MSVVIDELDVAASNGQTPAQSAMATPANISAPAPTVHDVERAIEQRCEREARVWAH